MLQSLGAWLALRPSEELLLEVSEDFSIRSGEGVEDVQVKASRAAAGPTGYSLNSKDVKEALERYWSRGATDSAQQLRLTFIAQGGAAKERGVEFPNGAPGLIYWRQAALGADTAPLRDALKQILAGTTLGAWVASEPSDEDFRTHLLRPVQWALAAAPVEVLQQELREQTQTLALSKGLPALMGSNLWRQLLDVVFETASQKDARLRRLSPAALHAAAEELVQADAVSRLMAMQSAQAPPHSLLIAPLEDSVWLASPRAETVATIKDWVGDTPLLWLHGAHGVGKSTLSRLLAAAYGGEWLAIDLKPLGGDAEALLAVWRSLQQIVIQHGLPDGLIIDDLDADAVNVLWPRLKALAHILFDRGGRLILNSHPTPSPARIAELGLVGEAVIQAPYFTQAEIGDLIKQDPAPDEDEREAWAFFIRGATGGGHPLLSAAKVASLRLRGWPAEALLEDVGLNASDAVRATRQEARQVLLKEINGLGEGRARDVGRMLRRIGAVFDRVDEPLVLRLSEVEPKIEASTDLLALLRGSWLELMPGGDLRVSPLIGDITDDVPEEDKKSWRALASIHWMAGRVLNERTIPLIFWNAYLGRQEWVLAKFCQVLLMQPRRALGGAAALLSPIAAFTTDAPIYPDNIYINVNLRLLQFEVAEALENSKRAGVIAARLFAELEAIDIAEIRTMMTAVASSKVLMAANADLAPSDIVRFALLLRQSQAELSEAGESDLVARSNAIVAHLDPSLDQADFLFAGAINKIATSSDFLELIEALDAISVSDRNRFLFASSIVFDGLSVLVNSGWSRDQLEDRDLSEALLAYRQAETIAARWDRPDMMVQLACAISVILDEGFKDEAAALAVLDSALAIYGPDQALVRQKSKVLGHYDRDAEALDVLLSVEDSVGGASLFDRALALRDGATSAARIQKFAHAARLYDKAATAIDKAGGRSALYAGLKIDYAMALWDGGDRAGGLATLAHVFDLIADLDPTETRQSERAHQFARGVGGLFAHDLGVLPGATRPNIAYGGASALSTDDEPRIKADLKPLSDNWRILALAERAAGLDIGIAARSLASQTGPGVASIEFLFFLDDYARAMREGDLDRIVVSGAAAVSALRVATEATASGDGMARVDAASLAAFNMNDLLAINETREALYRIPADILVEARLKGAWSPELLEKVEEACRRAFGSDDPWLEPFFKAASGRYVLGAKAPTPLWTASAASFPDDAVRGDPELRYKRDLLFVLHTGASAGRQIIEPLLLVVLREGWRLVLESQRFRLTSPNTHAPAIELALEAMVTQGLRGAAVLLLVADPAVRYGLTENLTEALRRMARQEKA